MDAINAILASIKTLSRADQIRMLKILGAHIRTDPNPDCDCTYLAPEIRSSGHLCNKCRAIATATN